MHLDWPDCERADVIPLANVHSCWGILYPIVAFVLYLARSDLSIAFFDCLSLHCKICTSQRRLVYFCKVSCARVIVWLVRARSVAPGCVWVIGFAKSTRSTLRYSEPSVPYVTYVPHWSDGHCFRGHCIRNQEKNILANPWALLMKCVKHSIAILPLSVCMCDI